jgi:RNA polymerase sigma-70 factor, ECF subfamily
MGFLAAILLNVYARRICLLNISATTSLPILGASKESRRVDLRGDTPANQEEISDELLMMRVRERDNAALALLFRRYGRIVRGIAFRVLRDESEADDLVQDFFVLIIQKSGLFDPTRGSPRSWILQIAYRHALYRRRSLNSRHFYTRVDLDDVGETLGNNRVTFRDSEYRLLDKIGLRSVFDGLSENQRQTLQMFFAEGHSLLEIAQKLKQTRANVKNHYFRGLEKLRKEFFGDKLRGGTAV